MLPENIVTLSGQDLTYLSNVLALAAEHAQRVRITIEGGGIKVARGGGIWTLPFGDQD